MDRAHGSIFQLIWGLLWVKQETRDKRQHVDNLVTTWRRIRDNACVGAEGTGKATNICAMDWLPSPYVRVWSNCVSARCRPLQSLLFYSAARIGARIGVRIWQLHILSPRLWLVGPSPWPVCWETCEWPPKWHTRQAIHNPQEGPLERRQTTLPSKLWWHKRNQPGDGELGLCSEIELEIEIENGLGNFALLSCYLLLKCYTCYQALAPWQIGLAFTQQNTHPDVWQRHWQTSMYV